MSCFPSTLNSLSLSQNSIASLSLSLAALYLACLELFGSLPFFTLTDKQNPIFFCLFHPLRLPVGTYSQ